MCMRTWDSKVYWQTTCRMGVSGGGELLRGGGHSGMEDGSILGRGEAISITEGKRGKERRDQEEKKEGL